MNPLVAEERALLHGDVEILNRDVAVLRTIRLHKILAAAMHGAFHLNGCSANKLKTDLRGISRIIRDFEADIHRVALLHRHRAVLDLNHVQFVVRVGLGAHIT